MELGRDGMGQCSGDKAEVGTESQERRSSGGSVLVERWEHDDG